MLSIRVLQVQYKVFKNNYGASKMIFKWIIEGLRSLKSVTSDYPAIFTVAQKSEIIIFILQAWFLIFYLPVKVSQPLYYAKKNFQSFKALQMAVLQLKYCWINSREHIKTETLQALKARSNFLVKEAFQNSSFRLSQERSFSKKRKILKIEAFYLNKGNANR